MGRKAATPASHPTYADMIKEAIVELKERSGSSLVAIKKFVGRKYKLPVGWEKKLSVFLKKLTTDGKLLKVKGSWKLGDPMKKSVATARVKKVDGGAVKRGGKAGSKVSSTSGKKSSAAALSKKVKKTGMKAGAGGSKRTSGSAKAVASKGKKGAATKAVKKAVVKKPRLAGKKKVVKKTGK